jgi:glucose-1-phosphate thymidylyltransferase
MRKAVILAAGLGTRMRKADEAARLSSEQEQIAQTGVKALIPIPGAAGTAARPFLDYVLGAIVDAGVDSVCLVIGPDHYQVRSYYEALPKKKLRIDFAVQAKPLGTANAVHAAETFAGNDPFLMINSDNYYPAAAVRALAALKGNGVAAFHREAMIKGSNIEAERIQKFAAAEIDANGHMTRVHEKPSDETLAKLGGDIFLSMNCWRFGPSIFEACRRIKLSARGEYEITDAAQFVIDELHEPFTAVKVYEPVLDMSSRADITEVGKRLSAMKIDL